MAKNPSKSDKRIVETTTSEQSLGEYLSHIRSMKKMTLREVEEASEKEVSNAYLSQLENNKIVKPSPNVLHTLAMVYAIPYEKLMEKAGYISSSPSPAEGVLRSGTGNQHGRAATFANDNLTDEEEEKLLEYLAFLRTRRGKNGSS